jgi:hypothetical protein
MSSHDIDVYCPCSACASKKSKLSDEQRRALGECYCESCGKWLVGEKALRRHMARKHGLTSTRDYSKSGNKHGLKPDNKPKALGDEVTVEQLEAQQVCRVAARLGEATACEMLEAHRLFHQSRYGDDWEDHWRARLEKLV